MEDRKIEVAPRDRLRFTEEIETLVLHEVLRAFPEESHAKLIEELSQELLPVPKLEHWTESARVLRQLYPVRGDRSVARMQNDILICLAARDAGAPVWSRDADFELICNHLGVGLLSQ